MTLSEYFASLLIEVRGKANTARIADSLVATVADARGLLHAALWFWDRVQQHADEQQVLDERPLLDVQGNDHRFTFGLVNEVCAVLTKHGYPRPTGVRFIALQQALFQFLYGKGEPG